jgi:hypothetical protein
MQRSVRGSGQQAHLPAPGRARAKSKENPMARWRAHPKTFFDLAAFVPSGRLVRSCGGLPRPPAPPRRARSARRLQPGTLLKEEARASIWQTNLGHRGTAT